MSVLVFKSDGNKKVKITNDGFGLELYTMRNGWQWTGQGVDSKLLHLMRDAINEYFENKDIINK